MLIEKDGALALSNIWYGLSPHILMLENGLSPHYLIFDEDWANTTQYLTRIKPTLPDIWWRLSPHYLIFIKNWAHTNWYLMRIEPTLTDIWQGLGQHYLMSPHYLKLMDWVEPTALPDICWGLSQHCLIFEKDWDNTTWYLGRIEPILPDIWRGLSPHYLTFDEDWAHTTWYLLRIEPTPTDIWQELSPH